MSATQQECLKERKQESGRRETKVVSDREEMQLDTTNNTWGLTSAGHKVFTCKGCGDVNLSQHLFQVVETQTCHDVEAFATELWPVQDLYVRKVDQASQTSSIGSNGVVVNY